MPFLSKFGKFLSGGDSLRPIDYLILMAITMIVFIRLL